MRLWMDSNNTVLTDEQAIRAIATFGSLAEAAQHENIRLISAGDDEGNGHNSRDADANTRRAQGTKPRLAEYLSELAQ